MGLHRSPELPTLNGMRLMKKNWKALVAIAAVVIIVAVAVVLINLRPSDQAAQPEPSADNGMVAGKFGFPVSKINIGEGGTKTAADGKTPIGYNGTCDSAAQAAANYTPVLVDVNLKTWETQKATLNSLAVPGPWLETALLPGIQRCRRSGSGQSGEDFWRRLDGTDQCQGRRNVPDGFLRTEEDCRGAGVFWCPRSQRHLAAGYFGTKTMELTWKGDWKISNARDGCR